MQVVIKTELAFDFPGITEEDGQEGAWFAEDGVQKVYTTLSYCGPGEQVTHTINDFIDALRYFLVGKVRVVWRKRPYLMASVDDGGAISIRARLYAE